MKIDENILVEKLQEIVADRPVVEGITIDNPDSKDLDDAINISKKGENYLLEVSIADVASIVKFNDELFEYALERAETLYFATYNLPMLPPVISEKHLSLWPGDLRPAITFYIELTPLAEVVDFYFKETAFQSLGKLSYKRFDRILKHEDDHPYHEKFKSLMLLAELLYRNRQQKGALVIYDKKRGIYTNEEGALLKLNAHNSFYGHLVVQEIAVLTNKTIAMFFAEKDIPFLFRNHTVKKSAPGRSDIIEQMNTSLIRTEYLQGFLQKLSLWFNKATYGTVLQGHFALNEPAYSHVTSPLRRLADLINHYLIKAYLHAKTSPLSRKDLMQLGDEINQKVVFNQEDKREYYREKISKESLEILKTAAEANLDDMKEGDFINVLRAAVENEILSPTLEQAVLKRFDDEKVNVKMFYIILFKSTSTDAKWQKLKKKIMKYIADNLGLAFHLAKMIEQKNILKEFIIDVKEKDGLFLAIAKGIFKNNLFTPDRPSVSLRKKDAMHDATFELLKKITGINVKKGNAVRDEKEVETADDGPGMPDINYVGELNVLCSKKKTFGVPQYQFKMSGPSHSPDITCNLTLITKKHTFEAVATAKNKKIAKQLAAADIFKQIEEFDFDKSDESASKHPVKSGNFVGSLLELCKQQNFLPPEFSFAQMGEGVSKGIVIFQCRCSLQIGEEIKKFTAFGRSKKQAKQNVAEECLNFLYKHLNI